MKKIFFLFALLASMTASATVTVTPLSVDYAIQNVTFSVSWTGTPYNNRVWVWIDFCSITGTSPGAFAKAEISGATATAGSIATVAGNTRGFYVTTNPSTVTATLKNATGKFNWCVYGSDYPPNVTAENGTYTLYGTPPFTLIAAGGTATQTVAASTIATSDVTITPVTLTDQTGYPGVFCIYSGSDLYIDGTHLCQQRASGAQNWEAWIKDTRDDELYRIVLMPDNKWWLADNIRYTKGNTIGRCSNDDAARCATPCGRWYNPTEILDASVWSTANPSATRGICPVNWHIPSEAETKAMLTSLSETTDKDRLIALKSNNTIAPLWTTCVHTGVLAGSDRYGFSIYPCGHANYTSRWTTDGYYKHADGICYRMFFSERDAARPLFTFETNDACNNDTPVRCARD